MFNFLLRKDDIGFKAYFSTLLFPINHNTNIVNNAYTIIYGKLIGNAEHLMNFINILNKIIW